MNGRDPLQGLGIPGENVDSYFHPLSGSLAPAQTQQVFETNGTFALNTRRRRSHLANPGLSQQEEESRWLTQSTTCLRSARLDAPRTLIADLFRTEKLLVRTSPLKSWKF